MVLCDSYFNRIQLSIHFMKNILH